MKLIATLLLLLGSAFGQTLVGGSVLGAQLLPAAGHLVWDFELCCGGETHKEAPANVIGAFNYVDGHLFLVISEPIRCKQGCTFSGNFTEWLPVQPINNCWIQSGTLVGEFTGERHWQNVTAEYSQIFCEQDGVFWSAGGDLTVHLE